MDSTLIKTNEEYICVIGDSFAGNRNYSSFNMGASYDWSWVNLIEANNSGQLIGKSFPGQSYFHQRRWFMENMIIDYKNSSSTVLIFLHSHWSRLPHMRDVPITAQVLLADKDNPKSNELFNADPTGKLFELAKEYYLSELFVEEFYQHSFYMWLKEIAEYTVNFKRVIHLFAYDAGLSDLPSRISRFYPELIVNHNTIMVNTTLKSLVAAERGSAIFGGPDIGPNVQNHFNKHNNIQLCKFIQSLINDPDSGKSLSIPLDTFDIKDPSLIETILPHRVDFDFDSVFPRGQGII